MTVVLLFFINEAECLECGEKFGVHDTKILKLIFKAHVCRMKEEVKNGKHKAV